MPCKKYYYFLAGLKDTLWLLGSPLSSRPELQLSLLWTLSTLSQNLPGQWSPCLLEHLFSSSAIPFSGVALSAWTAAYRALEGLRVCLSQLRSLGRWEIGCAPEEWGQDAVLFLATVWSSSDFGEASLGFPRPRALGKRRISVGSANWGGELTPPARARSPRAGGASGAERAGGGPGGGGSAGGAALPAVTSQRAEGRRTGSAPIPPPPGAGSVGPLEMLLPPAVEVAEHAAAVLPAPPP